jgi:hypothetical protein
MIETPPIYLDHMAAIAGKQTGRSWIPITEADLFPVAWNALADEEQLQIWDCSRRAAKTATLIRRTVKRSSERRNWRTLFIHHTRALGEKQFFSTGETVGPEANPGVMELLKAHNIPEAHHDLGDLNVTLGNGSYIQVVGCDKESEIGKKLGFRWNDIIIDECQEFDDDVLVTLVDKTLLPTLIDRKGTLTLSGTPADVHAGLWFDLRNRIKGQGTGYHHWTLLQNPFIDRENIVSIYAKRGFVIDFEHQENNNVVIQREIFGLWVVDPEALQYCYREDFNDWPVTGVPFIEDSDKPAWRFAMGVDIGGVTENHDSDGIVVYGWRMTDGTHGIWERESWRGRGDSEEFFHRVLSTFKRWQPMQSVCADTGGAGAVKMLARLSPQMGGLVFTPKPTSVETSQRLVNDELRSGRMKVDPLGELAKALKLCRKGKHEIDVAAAARYAFHGAYNWLAKDKPKPLDIDAELDRKRILRWQQQEKDARKSWQVM